MTSQVYPVPFTEAYKLSVLERYDACFGEGQQSACCKGRSLTEPHRGSGVDRHLTAVNGGSQGIAPPRPGLKESVGRARPR